MPELPDLTIVAEELQARATGRTVVEASAPTPILVRATPAELAELIGTTMTSARRRGKFLLLAFARDAVEVRILAANPMLAGRFWLLDNGGEKVRARTGLRLRFGDGGELRYVDREMLGKLYLVKPDALDEIPGWKEMGPDADDPALTLERFRERIRRHPGELKSLLRNSHFVAGIGNAYSDEILWEAQLAPLRRRSSLRPSRSTVSTPRCARCWLMRRSDCARWCRPTFSCSTANSSRCTFGAGSRARAVVASCDRSAGARRPRSAEPASLLPRAATARGQGMISTCPTLIVSLVNPLAALIASAVVPNCRAMAFSVSPCFTM